MARTRTLILRIYEAVSRLYAINNSDNQYYIYAQRITILRMHVIKLIRDLNEIYYRIVDMYLVI